MSRRYEKQKNIPKRRKHPRHFSVFRRYAPEKRYTIKQQTPLDRVRELTKQIFSSNPLFLGAVLTLFGLFLFAILFFSHFTSVQLQTPSTSHLPLGERPHVSIVYSNVFSAGEVAKKQRLFYAIVNISVPKSDKGKTHIAEILVSRRPPNLPREIFVLRDPSLNPTFSDQLTLELQREFKNNSVDVMEIDPAHLLMLPKRSLLIVPTNTMPSYLLNSTPTMLAVLSHRGVSVLYIGRSTGRQFSRHFSFIPGEVNITGLHFSTGDYVVRTYKGMMGYGGGTTTIFGGISVLLGDNDSYVYFVPTLLMNPKWNGKADLIADDIKKIITYPLINSSQSFHMMNFTVKWNGSSVLYPVYSYLSNSLTKDIKITVVLRNTSSFPTLNAPAPNTSVYVSGNFVYPASIYVDGSVNLLPYSIRKSKVMVYYPFSSRYLKNCSASLVVYSWNLTPLTSSLSDSSFWGVPVDISKEQVKPLALKLLKLGESKGNQYILGLLAGGKEVGGYSYARGFVHVRNVKVQLVGSLRSAEISHVYAFKFFDADTGSSLNLPGVEVYLDKKPIHHESNAVHVVVLNFKTHPLPVGRHVFLFKSRDWTYTFVLNKTAQSNPLFSPMFLGTIVFVLLLVVVATIFAKRGEEQYFLDIPDFPPFNESRVPVSKDKIVEMFERLEKTYRWKWIPLSIEELQKIFCTLVYKNRPVFVSEYNVHLLLSQLESQGIVQSAYGYYALSSWVKESGKSITELALYRKIRDLCIRKAIYFSPVDLKAKYDMELRIGDRRIFLFFMTPQKYGEKIAKALKNKTPGISVLLFNDDGEREHFTSVMNSPANLLALLKMKLFGRKMVLLTVKELAERIDEMKEVL